MAWILRAQLEVPFWCSFRVPYTVNVHFSYPVPPLTTLRGMLAAALGYPEGWEGSLAGLTLGVGLEQEGEVVESLSRIMKWDRRFAYDTRHTLVIRQKLIMPVYQLYACGERAAIQELDRALTTPVFPLFLGESDDVVHVTALEVVEARPVITDYVDNCTPVASGAAINEVRIAHLPVRFMANQRGSAHGVEYRDYYIARRVALQTPVSAWQLGERRVAL